MTGSVLVGASREPFWGTNWREGGTMGEQHPEALNTQRGRLIPAPSTACQARPGGWSKSLEQARTHRCVCLRNKPGLSDTFVDVQSDVDEPRACTNLEAAMSLPWVSSLASRPRSAPRGGEGEGGGISPLPHPSPLGPKPQPATGARLRESPTGLRTGPVGAEGSGWAAQASRCTCAGDRVNRVCDP
jgi:hypothetical protein